MNVRSEQNWSLKKLALVGQLLTLPPSPKSRHPMLRNAIGKTKYGRLYEYRSHSRRINFFEQGVTALKDHLSIYFLYSINPTT